MLVPTSALPAFTAFHVAVALAGIASGLVVLFGMILDRCLDAWTACFLATTAAASVTGFGFPFKGVTPGVAFSIISLAVLPTVAYARYARRLEGRWRGVYVIGAVSALYLNVVVLIVQSFQKVPALHALAPNQSEPPFLAAQLATLLACVVLGALAARRFQGLGTGFSGAGPASPGAGRAA